MAAAYPDSDRDAHLNALWELLPRANRAEFQRRLATTQKKEYFTGGDGDSILGRIWLIASGSGPSPAAQLPLIEIVDGLTAENRRNFVNLLISILRTYLTELGIEIPDEPSLEIEIPDEPVHEGGRRKRRSRRHRSNRRRKTRRNTRRH